MRVSEAVENYLETIYMLSLEKEGVHAADVCARLSYSRPTVSIMVHQLSNDGYLVIDDDNHLRLTQAGLDIAEPLYERHNLLANMLINLGVSTETAYKDACKIEHDLSDETYLCIKEHLDKTKP